MGSDPTGTRGPSQPRLAASFLGSAVTIHSHSWPLSSPVCSPGDRACFLPCSSPNRGQESPCPVLGGRPITVAGRMAQPGWQVGVTFSQPLGRSDVPIWLARAKCPFLDPASEPARVKVLENSQGVIASNRGRCAGSCESVTACVHCRSPLGHPGHHLSLHLL